MRPILHRASLVEMAVPYGDVNEPFQRKCAFDVGDYGLGYCANSLELGCDCLGHIQYFDGILNDTQGGGLGFRVQGSGGPRCLACACCCCAFSALRGHPSCASSQGRCLVCVCAHQPRDRADVQPGAGMCCGMRLK